MMVRVEVSYQERIKELEQEKHDLKERIWEVTIIVITMIIMIILTMIIIMIIIIVIFMIIIMNA